MACTGTIHINRQALRAGKYVRQVNEHGEDEEWRLISCPKFVPSDFPTAIQFASSLGRLMRFSGEILDSSNFYVDVEGYQQIGLGGSHQSVHCIICSTFNGPPPKQSDGKRYYEADHKNGKRNDNRANNLHWATIEEQMNNRGKRQVSNLEEGEIRELMRPAKMKKAYKLIPSYGIPKKERVYTAYVTDEAVTVDQLSGMYSIARSTTLGYIYSCFKPQHTNILVKKLGLDVNTVDHAYTVMRATQIARVNDGADSKQYTGVIHNALGENCTEPGLATQLLTRLYNNLLA